MTANGYGVSSKSRHYHALDSFVFEYLNLGGVKDNIKIEINYMLRCHLLELPRKSFRYIWEPSGISILCV
ncbi:MAG: nucleotidyl transferase AbiEii/AbiGii toxin family protein, partial [Bacillota bacterium]